MKDRILRWTHDTLIVVGFLSVFAFAGGLRVVGYHYVFELIPEQSSRR